MATYSVNWSAVLSSVSGAVSVGMCLVQNSAGTLLVGTTANRATYGRCVGIAETAGDGAGDTPVVRMVEAGIVPPSVTGLAAGTASWVRVSATGTLERVTPGSGDDIVGKAHLDGSVQFHPGVWDSSNYAGGTGGVTPPTGTGAALVTAGTFDAAATVLGAGVATWWTTPSSANLLAALTTKTGTGLAVFDTLPTVAGIIVTGNANLGDPGSESGSVNYVGATYAALFKVNNFDNGTNATAIFHRHSTVDGCNVLFTRTKSDTSSHATVASGDVISSLIFAGHDGTDYNPCAMITVRIAAAVGANDMPGAVDFYTTPDGSNVPTLAMTIDQAQVVTLAQPLAAGSGGTGLAALGTGVATFLGTPSGANLASALTTALPATKGGTGLTALGTGVATFLGTPTTANFLAAVTGETGTGEVVFSTAPLFKTTINVNNPANTFKYVVTPAAIAADRILNLPLLLATDTVAVLDFAQTFTNKTISLASNTLTFTSAQLKTACSDETGSGGALVFATSPTLTTPVINGQVWGPIVAIAAMAIDWTLGTVFTKTLSAGANTFTFANQASGMAITVRVTGAASTLAWPTVKWAAGAAPTQTASGIDVYTFVHDGTSVYGSVVQAMA